MPGEFLVCYSCKVAAIAVVEFGNLIVRIIEGLFYFVHGFGGVPGVNDVGKVLVDLCEACRIKQQVVGVCPGDEQAIVCSGIPCEDAYSFEML